MDIELKPVVGLKTVRLAMAAAVPGLYGTDPEVRTTTVRLSRLPVHGTPGKGLVKEPEPCTSLFPLDCATDAFPKATLWSVWHW